MKKQRNEVLKLTRWPDGMVVVERQDGKQITLPAGSFEATARYFEEGAETAWIVGKFFAPGDRDNIPLWLTIVCGIGGVLIGYYLAAALGVEATRGIDWTRWIISIVVAAVLVMIAASVTGRRGRAI